jgi:hypothetical protein
MAFIGLGLALLPVSAARGSALIGFTYTEVAKLGIKGPGGGTLVHDFEPGHVSPQGEVAFVVDYDYGGNDGNNSEALYLASNGTLIPIMEPPNQVGAAAPDWHFIENGPIGEILSPVGMNVTGDIAFGCDIQKKGETDIHTGNFLWIRKTGQMVVANLSGDKAPDFGQFGETHGSTWCSVNDQDDVAFAADVSDSQGNIDQGVFVLMRSTDRKVHTIARPGDKLADGSTIAQARRPNINNAGAVVFEATTDKSNGDVSIYLSQGGKITTLAAPNTNVPGIGQFVAVKRARMNNQGTVVFLGQADSSGNWGLYQWSNGKVSALLQPNGSLGDGTKLDTVLDKDGSEAIADTGDVAVLVQHGGDNAVYLIHGGQPISVAHSGQNLGSIGTIDQVVNPSGQFEHVALNTVPQIAFPATFKDGHAGLVLATAK